MKKISLFKFNNSYITNIDFIKNLEKIKAYDCKVLYIHSEINFGIPNPKLEKKKILEILFQCITEMAVPTLCIPTYTFSFCNKEIFDVQKSVSKMGILSEFIRKKRKGIRTIDPLLSVCIYGENKGLARDLGKDSIGFNSHFDKIHNSQNVKFLFFGPTVGSCFTYMHYIEKLLEVPYRYDREFKGLIINNKKKCHDKYNLFVRYNGVNVGNGSFIYEENMFKKKISQRKKIANGRLTSVNKDDAYQYFMDLYNKNNKIFFRSKRNSFNDKTFFFKNILTL